MKNILIIQTILFIQFSLLSGQTIPPKANTIIITDTLTMNQYYSTITEILFESGYGIQSTDKETGTITTTEKAYKNGSIKLVILVKDNKVLLRGDFKSDLEISLYGVTSEASWSVIENIGGKKSVYQNAWSELQKFANVIPGKKEYLIR